MPSGMRASSAQAVPIAIVEIFTFLWRKKSKQKDAYNAVLRLRSGTTLNLLLDASINQKMPKGVRF